jgi:hypothetical protein
VRARSPVDGSWKQSGVYRTPGRYDFVVGDEPLRVKLVDQSTGAGMAGLQVKAFEVLPDGRLEWRTGYVTDAAGVVTFDLDGLGAGRRYAFKARPFGQWLTSAEVAAPGWFGWRVNAVPVTLIDEASGDPLASARVVVYEKAADGSLSQLTSATSDAAGELHLELARFQEGARYLLKIEDPFSSGGDDYFGPLIERAGAVSISLIPGRHNRPDLTAPRVDLRAPSIGSTHGKHGFQVSGHTSDDRAVRSVTVELLSGGELLGRFAAAIDRNRQTFNVEIGAVAAATPARLEVRAFAVDDGDNVARDSVTFNLIEDVTPPVLGVASHRDGEDVATGSLLITGTVVDDTGDATVRAHIAGPDDRALQVRDLEIGRREGRWAYPAFLGELAPSAPVTVVFVARDEAGNEGRTSLHLMPSAIPLAERHLLSRIGYGPTSDALTTVRELGMEGYISQQLAPDTIDDGAASGHAAEWTQPADLVIGRARYSRRQLLEVMTWFWDNHFNTALASHGIPAYETGENERFRAHALGRFRDLLGVSAKSPAMLHFLDGVSNIGAQPNENYAREVMELHTLGIDGGYTETDVREAARAFSGWTVREGRFVFNPDVHDPASKELLGHTLPDGGGIADGEAVLDILAVHPATGRHVCAKLIELLVSDAVPSTLFAQCADRFALTESEPDQIGQVVHLILTSQDFRAALLAAGKVRTPLEYVVAVARILDGTPRLEHLDRFIAALGMPLFRNRTPLGFSEGSAAWVGADALLGRLRYLARMVMGRGPFAGAIMPWKERIEHAGFETVDGYVGCINELILGPDFTRADFEFARAILTDDGTVEFDLGRGDAEDRLARTAMAIMALPAYHYQ